MSHRGERGYQNGTKFGRLIEAALYITTPIGKLWPKGSGCDAKIVKGVKIVTLFAYTVWPSAIKFDIVRGIGA